MPGIFDRYKVTCKQHHRAALNPFLPAATKLGQGNAFTGVCDSVHGGGSASVHAGIPPRTRPPPPDQADPPPGKQTAAYGQRAAGTHPTGMHSC